MAEQRMQWDRLLTFDRCDPKSTDDERSEFQRDMDRIWFCDPFRRLARKSQVHPLNENDHVHSRLTHSLEVASVGRSLGERCGRFLEERGELPDDIIPYHLGQIVQAACLAHDIGNPPFGHSGEAAIKDWFGENHQALEKIAPECVTDFTRFDGNAMAVRILLKTMFHDAGMNPTLPVLGALLKYPWPSSQAVAKPKFSYFQTEAEQVELAMRDLGLLDLGDRFSRHPLAYLTEAADDLCYRTIDLEDATEMNIVDREYMYREFAAVLREPYEAWGREYEALAAMHYRQRNSIIRTNLIGLALDEVMEIFEDRYDDVMLGTFPHTSSLLEEAAGPVCKALLKIYGTASKTLFVSRRKAVLELGAQHSLGALLSVIMNEVGGYCDGQKASGEDKIKSLLGKDRIESIAKNTDDCPYHVAMAALDYVTGMSDHYATETCRKLMGLGF